MSVHLCIYVRALIHTYLCLYTCIYIYTRPASLHLNLCYVSIYLYLCIYMRTLIHTYLCQCIYIYTKSISLNLNLCYVSTSMHLCTIYMRTLIHTYLSSTLAFIFIWCQRIGCRQPKMTYFYFCLTYNVYWTIELFFLFFFISLFLFLSHIQRILNHRIQFAY